jgi:hypothetical protein
MNTVRQVLFRDASFQVLLKYSMQALQVTILIEPRSGRFNNLRTKVLLLRDWSRFLISQNSILLLDLGKYGPVRTGLDRREILQK